MKKLIALAALASTLVACTNNYSPDAQAKLNSLDSLIAVVDTLETEHYNTNRDGALAEQKRVQDLYAWYQQNYQDTSNRNFWVNDLSALDRADRAFKKGLGSEKSSEEGLEFAAKQLRALKSNFTSGELEEAQFLEYVEMEKAAVKELYRQVHYYYLEIPVCLAIMDTLGPKLDSIRNAYIPQ